MTTVHRLAALAIAAFAALASAQTLSPPIAGSGPGFHDPRSAFKPLEEREGILSWKLLSSVQTKVEKNRVVPTFPGPVQALNDKTVRVQGFMMPLEPGEKQKHFLQPESATLRLRVASVESPPMLVFLDAPGAGDLKVGQGARPTVQLTSVGSVFEPAFQVAPLAARVQVGNADPIAHNTHVFDGRRTLFNVALPVQGVPVTRVLGRAGLFEVRCDLHSWMRAALFVPPNPHHAVIREAGEFVLRDIAPGSHRLHVWSRGRGESVQAIDLSPGATQTLDLAAR